MNNNCGCALSIAALPLVKDDDYIDPYYGGALLYTRFPASEMVLRLGLTEQQRDDFVFAFDGYSKEGDCKPYSVAGKEVRNWYLSLSKKEC